MSYAAIKVKVHFPLVLDHGHVVPLSIHKVNIVEHQIGDLAIAYSTVIHRIVRSLPTNAYDNIQLTGNKTSQEVVATPFIVGHQQCALTVHCSHGPTETIHVRPDTIEIGVDLVGNVRVTSQGDHCSIVIATVPIFVLRSIAIALAVVVKVDASRFAQTEIEFLAMIQTA